MVQEISCRQTNCKSSTAKSTVACFAKDEVNDYRGTGEVSCKPGSEYTALLQHVVEGGEGADVTQFASG